MDQRYRRGSIGGVNPRTRRLIVTSVLVVLVAGAILFGLLFPR